MAKKQQKSTNTTVSKRAGIIFPCARVRRHLKRGKYAKHIGVGGSVYLASVLEYLVSEILELSGDAAKENRKKRLIPRHIMLAVRNDHELNELLKDVTFASSGVLPHIETVLLPKKSTHKKKKKIPDAQSSNSD